MMVRLISLGQGPLSLSSSYTSFFSPSIVHSPSPTLSFPGWWEIDLNVPPAKEATHVENLRLLAATTVQQSKVNLSQSSSGEKCDIDAASRLLRVITPHQIGYHGQLPNSHIATEISSSILSKGKGKYDATDAVSTKRLAICAPNSPKPMPTLLSLPCHVPPCLYLLPKTSPMNMGGQRILGKMQPVHLFVHYLSFQPDRPLFTSNQGTPY
jgi:hypothetical protein